MVRIRPTPHLEVFCKCLLYGIPKLFSFNFVGTDNIQRYSGVNWLVKQSLVAWALSFFSNKSVHGTINNEL